MWTRANPFPPARSSSRAGSGSLRPRSATSWRILTDAGFLAQPHTSAGRIPTDRAYRLYIDELMRNRNIAEDVREEVDSDLASAGPDLARLFQAASRLLSRLSGEMGFVVAPDALHTVVRSIRFLSVAPGKSSRSRSTIPTSWFPA